MSQTYREKKQAKFDTDENKPAQEYYLTLDVRKKILCFKM